MFFRAKWAWMKRIAKNNLVLKSNLQWTLCHPLELWGKLYYL